MNTELNGFEFEKRRRPDPISTFQLLLLLSHSYSHSLSKISLYLYLWASGVTSALFLRRYGRRSETRDWKMLLIRSLRSRLQRPSSSYAFSSAAAASAAAVQSERTIREGPRNDWSRDEVKAIYDSPVLDLLFHGVSFVLLLPWFSS